MAQVCGGTNFDIVAGRKHDAAQRILSRAADTWATHGRDTLDVDSVLAVLLRIFLARRSEYIRTRWEMRPLEKWLPMVGTAVQEADSLIPATAQPHIAEILTLLHAELSCAVDQWLLGDPEKPPTAHALNALIHVLFTHKLILRPPSPKFPTSVISS